MAEASLDALIDALRQLPGVGQKSAQRMAYHLLQNDRGGAGRLATALQQALAQMQHCQRCHTFTEHRVCATCEDAARDARLLRLQQGRTTRVSSSGTTRRTLCSH